MPSRERSVTTSGPEETEALAAAIARQLVAPRLVALIGPLGAGKTTFARGFVHALPGGAALRVKSPTFALATTYPTRPPVHHIDLYRLEEERALTELGLEEQMSDEEALVLVEWADRFPSAIPQSALVVHLPANPEPRRALTLSIPDGLDLD